MKFKIQNLIPVTAAMALTALLMWATTGCVHTQPQSNVISVTNAITGQVTLMTNVVAGTTSIDTNALIQGIKMVATLGVQEAVNADTNTIPYLKLSASTLALAIQSGQTDPTELVRQIQALNINGTTNAQVVMSLTAALSAYQVFFGQTVSQNIQNASPILTQCLQAIVDGIRDGLGANLAPGPKVKLVPFIPPPATVKTVSITIDPVRK